jgi:AraC-like DNA-binding protein
MEYIILLGAFQALLALCLFVVSRQRKPADSILTWILICLFTHLSIKFIIYAISDNPHLKVAFNTFIDLAYGPLLWMYARKVKDDRYRPAQHWYLLLPTFAAAAFYIIISIRMIDNPTVALAWLRVYNTSTQYLIMAFMGIFPALCLLIVHKLPAFWRSEQQLIKKVSTAFLIMTGIWVISQLNKVAPVLDTPTLVTVIRIIAYTNLLVICLFIIQYRLAAQALNKVVPDEKQPDEPADLPTPAVLLEDSASMMVTVQPAATMSGQSATPRRAALSTLHQEAIAVKLSVLMLEKKVYTDPELTLEKLSSMSQTPRHHLSEVLNQYLNQTFYQYINDYRMKEVLHLLDRCRQQQVTPNILSLAYDAGFNSKSSFNQYFKKSTGYTPTEYLKLPAKAITPRLPAGFIGLQQSIQPH